MKNDPNSRFNRLLRAMLDGPAPSQQPKRSGEEEVPQPPKSQDREANQ